MTTLPKDMSGYNTKIFLSWDDIRSDSIALANKLSKEWAGETGLPERMLAITRGGMIPASIIAYKLGIKNIETIGLESYEGQGRSKQVDMIKKACPDFLEKTLIIDDVADTGGTFAFLRSLVKDCVFASPYAKPKGEDYADCFVRTFEQEEWIVFPWDV